MKSNRNCFVLVADGFAENSIAQTADFFSTTHLNLTLLNLYLSPDTQELAAKYRMNATQNLLLGDVQKWELPDGLLLAGGSVCGQHLLVDPRVYQLVQRMYHADKPVGFLYPIYVPFAEAVSYLPGRNQLLFQERLQTRLFFQNFIRQMTNVDAIPQPQSAALIF